MRWGKIVLFVQAVATLIIGIVFLSQVLVINTSGALDQMTSPVEELPTSNTQEILLDLKQRYATATYILVVVGIIEILIISRLVS